MNAVVQGTAGDIVKNAMVDIHEKGLVDWEPATKSLPYGGSSIVANIHDELVFQIPRAYPYQAIGRRIIQVMEGAGSALGIVTPCDAKLIETNWAEGVKFK
jgi:DNA polymerase I-like protein with 3'-5' exonuclease and polymerase domains